MIYDHSLVERIYQHSPLPLQHAWVSAYGLLKCWERFTPTYRRYVAELEQAQWRSPSELRFFQEERLQILVRHVYENVPYYKRTFNSRRIKPEDIRRIEDIKILPLLSKEIVRQNLHDLVAQNYAPSTLLHATTGGSAGAPLEFYCDRRTASLEAAFMWRQWNWAGYQFGDRTVVLRGNVPKDGWWEYDPLNKALVLSPYHLREDSVGSYVEKIRRFQPVSIQAYPSLITIIANYMTRKGIPPINSVKVILCGSENLFPAQRFAIEAAFQCRVFSWYGHTESATLAGECEVSSRYHVFSEYGIAEVVDENGAEVTNDGGIGEIISTGFNNYAVPFIRYRTEDMAVISTALCRCGRKYPLWERVEGRKQEYVVTADDRLVSLTALIFAQHFNAFSNMERMQLVQGEKGKVKVNIVKTNAYSEADEKEVRGKMLGCVREGLELEFFYPDDIPVTERGKHKLLIQNLPIELWLSGGSDES